MKPPECNPLGNIIPDSLFYCTGLSILMIYLFSKIPIFHTWIPVSLLCFSVCQHTVTCITNSPSLQRSYTCITVENSNVWVSSELVTITSTSPNIILIYISNFVTLFNKLPSAWIYKYMYIRLSLLLQVHWAMIDSITSDCGVIIWPITTS